MSHQPIKLKDMKTIYEDEVLNNFEEEFEEELEEDLDLIEFVEKMAKLDLSDSWMKFPQKVLDAYNKTDEDLVKDVCISNLDGANDGPQDEAGQSSSDAVNAEVMAHRAEVEKEERQKILKKLRYEVDFDLQDLAQDVEENEFATSMETYSSRHKANESVMALFQSWMVQTRCKVEDWVEQRGYANPNEICYFVDEDGCIRLGASRHNDIWNLRIRAKRIR
ncbi:hypothetical protein F5X68DRAFT_273903 [Plectosphaerella plurivora]|uniref:Uncharacterized protein n=1 Tax=Plectosphaerella plurivora TaxID=936078 RepID=A0A9P9AFA2_9PEZI|nr:hypothetical protein F5X68DRAFT_273903 [Plectosphaerella plurivora]